MMDKNGSILFYFQLKSLNSIPLSELKYFMSANFLNFVHFLVNFRENVNSKKIIKS